MPRLPRKFHAESPGAQAAPERHQTTPERTAGPLESLKSRACHANVSMLDVSVLYVSVLEVNMLDVSVLEVSVLEVSVLDVSMLDVSVLVC